jgi:hypothetical protein
MRNLKGINKQKSKRETKATTSEVGGSYHNSLKTYRQHTLLAIGIIVFSAIITLWVLTNNMKKYKASCQSTFIYYKNGSSVLVSNKNEAIINR